ncbi:unnamed protein product [Cylindrotheca closterium]|uniref:PPM-type phosphatase domain-containing protein n=1 Tax=Cylindrotheca closterium TaxID=2856 RepID=A0AAD2FV54_9STRA|nr:unnamed protein product [Cylindrotheca closterium]
MGNTLDKPKTEKDTSVGVSSEDGLSWGVSSMQGWRLTMEDAHIIASCHATCAAHPNNSKSSCDAHTGEQLNTTHNGNHNSKNTRPRDLRSKKSPIISTDPNNEGGRTNGQNEHHVDEIKEPTNDDDGDFKLPPHHYFFCVLDGHGGDFAAYYCADHLLPILLEQDSFQEYERIWRETLSTSAASSSSSKMFKNKKRKTEWQSKNNQHQQQQQGKNNNDSHHQNHSSKSKWNKKNANKASAKKKIAIHQKLLLQRALEDAFVELDLMLLQEMVLQKMVVIPTDMDYKNSLTVAAYGTNMDDDDWGTYDTMEEDNASSSSSLMKSQNAHGDTIPGTTAVAVLVTPDWILCANLGDSRASLLLSSSNQKGNSMIHEQQNSNPQHTNSKKKKKRKENKKKNGAVAKKNDDGDCGPPEQAYWTIVALSEDHKPDLPEEQTRIEAANGSVTMGGRVDGELAVSRAFGDFGFKETYPRHLYNCQSPSSITKRQNRRRKRRMQARLQGDVSSNGIDEKSEGEKEEDLDWERQRTMAQQLKVSPFPEVFAYPRGELKHEEADSPNCREKILLLGCDGIWDVMTNEHCHKLVQELLAEREANMGLVAEEILDTCLKKGSRDNMTMMVVHFSDLAIDAGGSQTTSSGGGVLKRRKQRNSANQG